jgi:hypothetical protein
MTRPVRTRVCLGSSIVAFALVGAACAAGDASDDLASDENDLAFCPHTPRGWHSITSYVPASGTNLQFSPFFADAVWTGHEAFLLGTIGYSAGCPTTFCQRNEAAAYDPSTDTWRTLASPYPVSARDSLVSRWTGTTWIVFGGFDETTGHVGLDGRRYDPATDTWSDIPAVPSPGLYGASVEWSPKTDELVVFGGVRLTDGFRTPSTDDPYAATNETWVWSLATNTWRQVESSPLSPRMASHAAWDGARIVFAWGRAYEPDFEGVRSIPGTAAYDPVSATWTKLPDPAVEDRMAFGARRIAPSRAVFWGGHPALGDGDLWPTLHDGAAWNRAADRWQTIKDPGLPGPYRRGFTTWSGDGRLFVWGGDNFDEDGFVRYVDGASWRSAGGSWKALAEAPESRSDAVAVWTGCDAIVYGGFTAQLSRNNAGMMLRP